jgi:hypothetical protein
MTQPSNEKWADYISWMLTPEHLRGTVTTDAAWARKHNVTDRTLRRWKTLPEFNALYEAMKAGVVANLAPSQSTSLPESDANGGDEADYRMVKSALLEGAKKGNPKYLELYFRTYGKPFVDEEVAARSADLAGMDLDDLVSRALAAVDPETLSRVLSEHGWTVMRSDGDGSARLS